VSAPPRIAALDVGSNTVHLLVAEPLARGVRELRREVVMPRLGAAVGATGRIGPAKIAEVAAEVRRLAALARDCDASILLCCATEAVRRADDRDGALQAFSAAAGVAFVLISSEVEARLAFRGAVAMSPGDGLAAVCDIGGGSTEIAVGSDSTIAALASLEIGSGAVTDRWLHDDPPTRAQLDACATAIRSVLVAGAPQASPQRVIATGGTASALGRLLAGTPESVLTAANLDRLRTLLATTPSAELARIHALDPARARVLAGGVEIVEAIRAHYAAESVQTTIHGLRTGMILAFLENGDRWVDG
jgi:exopolyphosphatase/guanosine-5'-triphosphate,3'-diphosphate pyrophosphatase